MFNQNNINGKLQQMGQQNPMKREMINALLTGDRAKGEQLANNILQSYGLSREEALQQANAGLPGLLQKFLASSYR